MTQIECKLGDLDPQVSPDELRELDAAERLVPAFDEDSPAMTVEQLRQFKHMGTANRTQRKMADRASKTED